jgi:hypothetical protein
MKERSAPAVAVILQFTPWLLWRSKRQAQGR